MERKSRITADDDAVDAAREFPEDDWHSHEALQIENAIMDEFIAGNGSKEAIVKCREIASQVLR